MVAENQRHNGGDVAATQKKKHMLNEHAAGMANKTKGTK